MGGLKQAGSAAVLVDDLFLITGTLQADHPLRPAARWASLICPARRRLTSTRMFH